MGGYGAVFARVYDRGWSGFAEHVGPAILSFYAKRPAAQNGMRLLDLCCGTGQLALHFLQNGYQVVGIDLSEPMLAIASDNADRFVETGQARFQQGDASDFQLDERFGLVVSTYDSLNQLEDERALANCFRCVHAVCDGTFIFDLNTRKGLLRWNGIHIEDREQMMVVNRGIYDGIGDRAWLKISGFIRNEEGTYDRFDETAHNTVFELEAVRSLLLDVGWGNAYFALAEDLAQPISEPEEEGRVFIVATKGAQVGG